MDQQTFSREEMLVLAGQARMELDESQLEEARLDMEAAFVRLLPLTEADTSGVEPMLYVQAGGKWD